MSHEVETMAYAGEKPWHGLGNPLKRGAKIDTWVKKAGMDWEAIERPVQFTFEGKKMTVEGKKVLCRSDNGMPLSIVTNFQVVQPRAVLEFFRDLVETYEAFDIETAGVLLKGKRIWAMARSKEDFTLIAKDRIQRNLLFSTGFDRKTPTTVKQTSVAVVCWNTLQAAMGEATASLRILHNRHFDEKEVKQRMMLDDEWQAFAAAVEKMAVKKLGIKKANQFLFEALFSEEDRQKKRFSEDAAKKRVEKYVEAAQRGPGANLSTRKGTLWGLVNGVTYYIDHETRAKDQDARLNSAWFGRGEQVKQKVLVAASKLV